MKKEAPSERPLTTLRIAGVPEHFNLPWQLGLERRAFVRVGLDVKWRTVPEGTGAMCAMLRDDEVDIAMLITEGAVRDILNGNPSRIISPYVDSPLTWGVHVGVNSGITHADQVKDLPFAISRPNSGSQLAAITYAHAQGRELKEKDFEVVNDLKGALNRLAMPAPVAFLWEKYTTKPHVDSGALRCVDEYRSTWPSFMLVARQSILEAHPKEVERLLKVIRDQAAGLMTKKTAPAMVAQRYGMNVEDAQEWFSAVRWNTGASADVRMLNNVVQVLTAAGIPPPAMAMDDLAAELLWQRPGR